MNAQRAGRNRPGVNPSKSPERASARPARPGRLRRAAALAVPTLALALAGTAALDVPVRADVRSLERTSSLGGGEVLVSAEAIHRRAVVTSERIVRLLDEARYARAARRARCLDDRLAQSNASIREIERRLGALRAAVGAHDDARRDHEHVVVARIGRHVEQIETEARICAGLDPSRATNRTRVVMTVDPSTPRDDPTRVPGSQAGALILPPRP